MALGAFLEVIADQLKGAPGGGHAVSPLYALSLVAGAVAVYLVSVSWMGAQVTGSNAGLQRVWAGSLLLLAAVVGAVAAGLPLAWALPALTLAPGLVIVMVERGVVQRTKHFAIH